MSVVGLGPMADDVRARAEALGVGEAIDLRGYVAYGRDLFAEYRRAHVFLHVSLTEGLPQVLFEAQAAGLPIVATDVGGVSAALGGGEAGLLVPPNDARAAAAALRRVAEDTELRETLDVQTERIAAWFRDQLRRRGAVLAEPLLEHDQAPDVR